MVVIAFPKNVIRREPAPGEALPPAPVEPLMDPDEALQRASEIAQISEELAGAMTLLSDLSSHAVARHRLSRHDIAHPELLTSLIRALALAANKSAEPRHRTLAQLLCRYLETMEQTR